MALREDEVVVPRIVRIVEVVPKVLREQDRHQVGGGHRRGRMPGLRDGGRADRVDAQLLAELTPEFRAFHAGNVTLDAGRRRLRPSRRQAARARARGGRARRARDRSTSGRDRARAARSTIPDKAREIGEAIQYGGAERGVFVCGSGVGASIAASKLAGIRAAICHDTYSAHQGVEHDDMNVLCIGSEVDRRRAGRRAGSHVPGAKFDGGERYVRRLEKIEEMEKTHG